MQLNLENAIKRGQNRRAFFAKKQSKIQTESPVIEEKTKHPAAYIDNHCTFFSATNGKDIHTLYMRQITTTTPKL